MSSKLKKNIIVIERYTLFKKQKMFTIKFPFHFESCLSREKFKFKNIKVRNVNGCIMQWDKVV